MSQSLNDVSIVSFRLSFSWCPLFVCYLQLLCFHHSSNWFAFQRWQIELIMFSLDCLLKHFVLPCGIFLCTCMGIFLHVELLCLVNAMRWESVYNLEADDVETWFLSIALRWACLFLLWDVRSKRATPSLNKPLPRHQLWVWSGSPGASLRVHWF